MNLLNAKFICHHESKGPLIYSYNPYTNQAPYPWQVEKTYRIKDEHPWTLVVRNYQASQEICDDLDFDQTKDLGGYEIRAAALPSHINKNPYGTNFESVTDLNGILVRYIFRALNSKIKIIDTQSIADLVIMSIRGGTDITLTPWRKEKPNNIQMTYPHWRYEMATITQHRGNLSQIEKLLRVIDHSSRYAVVLVCFVTFVFFKFFLRQSVSSTFLTIVRLICNAAVPKPPNNVPTRIYLSGLFMFVITLQGIYQGKWASLLTKPVALPNVDTFEDLEKLNYTIYGRKALTSDFETWNYSGLVVTIDDSHCAQYVLRDDSGACVGDRRYLVYIANKYDFHLGSTITQMFFSYVIRNDWPLEKRFNIIISQLVESNIIEDVAMKDFQLILRKQKFHEKEKENQGFTVIALKDLAFAFAILGSGLASATAVFFVEVWKGRK